MVNSLSEIPSVALNHHNVLLTRKKINSSLKAVQIVTALHTALSPALAWIFLCV